MEKTTTMTLADRVGLSASTACAIHCALLPIALPILSVIGLGWLDDERVEWGLFASILVVGGFAMIRGQRRHRRRAPAALFLVALSTLTIGRMVEGVGFPVAEPYIMTLGGLLTALSHWLNHRALCRCPLHQRARS